MRVCVVAEYYPRRRDPVLGVWAHRQALAARAAGADVRVLALERRIPPMALVHAGARGRLGPLARWLGEVLAQPRHDRLDGVDVEYVRFVSPPRALSYADWARYARGPVGRALRRLDRSWGIELVHAHYALPAGAAALAYAQAHDLPLAVSVHGGDVYGPALMGARARARVAAVLARAAVVLCNSRITLERAAALGAGRERMDVVHLGAEAPLPAPAKHRQPTVATLAHVVPRKRHADVAQALAALVRRGHDVHWAVIGHGPSLPALRELVARLGLDGRVRWLGQLSPDQALTELARSHAMAMPSLDEAFGVAYVEAMACGVPAIGCRGEGGPEEIAALGEGMLLVPLRDPEALADAIERALADPDLTDAATRTAAEHFSWERCGADTVAAYERALSRVDDLGREHPATRA